MKWTASLVRKSIIISLAILFSFVMAGLSQKVSAEIGSTSWSWVNGRPTVLSSRVIKGLDFSSCNTKMQFLDVAGELGSREMCVNENDRIHFGSNYYPSEGFRSFVSIGYDKKMYTLNSPCAYYDSCIYMPNSDTLVTKQYLINGYVRSLVIYKNFTSRLTPSLRLLTKEYNFDASDPDYVFKNDKGYAWPIGGIGASDDGRWLGIEFRQRGFGILDVNDFTVRMVSSFAFSYGTGYDPSSEIAVSDGGRQIAIVGLNAGLNLFEINSECGDIIKNGDMDNLGYLFKPCQAIKVDSASFINRFFYAIKPRFSRDGGELSFYATSYIGDTRDVVIRAAGYGGMFLNYLALGDSFTSGEGELDDSYYNSGTNIDHEKCHVSSRSYPYLISALSNINPVYMKSVACSGAKTIDIIDSGSDYQGQGGRLGKSSLGLGDFDRVMYKNDALYQFTPGRALQNDFVGHYKPKIVTVGIGGNDVGFFDKLLACMSNDVCSWAGTSKGKEMTALEIKGFYNKLVNTYQKVHEKSPNSLVYAVGYPKVIDSSGDCGLVVGAMLDKTEREFMNESVAYLNKVINAAARNVGIKYIDIENSYGDSVLCGKTKPIAMNGVKYGDDSSLFKDSDWFKVIGQESFHPNNFGHKYTAESIFRSVGDIMNYKYCSDGETVCPVTTSAPEPSAYWMPGSVHDYPSQRIANYVFSNESNQYGRRKHLLLSDGSLSPNSEVSVEITSQASLIGEYKVDGRGSLSVDIELPNNISEGYHTMHLYGNTYSGESVELYQVIEYRLDRAQAVNGMSNQSSLILKSPERLKIKNIDDDAPSGVEGIVAVEYEAEPHNESRTPSETTAVKGVYSKNGNNKLNYFNIEILFGVIVLLILPLILVFKFRRKRPLKG